MEKRLMSETTIEKSKKLKRERSTTTKGHYVTNAKLLPAIEKSRAEGRITHELAVMLKQIAERYSLKSWFIGYSYREDMIAYALLNLCANALKFDPSKGSNPFAYYTTCVHNSFQQFKIDEKKHRDIRDKLMIDAGANPSYGYSEREHEHFKNEHQDFFENY
jgi:DNA-directed RNA polymerase specialized sigma subunit